MLPARAGLDTSPGLHPGVTREGTTPHRSPRERGEARRNGGSRRASHGAFETPVTASGSPNSRHCAGGGAPLAGSAAAESSTASDLTPMVRHLAGPTWRRSAAGPGRFTQKRQVWDLHPQGWGPLRDQWPARRSSGPRQPPSTMRARTASAWAASVLPAQQSSALAEMACVDAWKSLTLRTQ
jgi:hypothetical protein